MLLKVLRVNRHAPIFPLSLSAKLGQPMLASSITSLIAGAGEVVEDREFCTFLASVMIRINIRDTGVKVFSPNCA